MRRVLCFIGFHRWGYLEVLIRLYRARCIHCGEKSLFYNGERVG